MREQKKITLHKTGPWNLLVDRKKPMVQLITFVLMSFQIAMFETGMSWYYLTIYDRFYLNYSGECNAHYYKANCGGKNELQIQDHFCIYI